MGDSEPGRISFEGLREGNGSFRQLTFPIRRGVLGTGVGLLAWADSQQKDRKAPKRGAP